jgi:hypothetical protein
VKLGLTHSEKNMYKERARKTVRRTTFVPNREEVPGRWIKLHNEEFHDLYSSNIITAIKPSTYGKIINAY